MNTSPSSPTQPTKRRTLAIAATVGVATVALLTTTGCSGNVVHNYRTFQSALDRGASCSELHDQRARFDDEDNLTKIDRDLNRIGCTSPNASRND
jgi:type VI protein secretion system component VasK